MKALLGKDFADLRRYHMKVAPPRSPTPIPKLHRLLATNISNISIFRKHGFHTKTSLRDKGINQMIQINRQVLSFLFASFLLGSGSFGQSFEPAYSVTPSLANSIAQSSNVEALLEQGNAKYAKQDYRGAIADYNEAIRINPNYAEAYYNRGIEKYALGDKQGAMSDYNEAIRINPNFAPAYSNRGLAKYELGDKKGAIADYNEAIRIDPNFAEAYYNRGLAKYELGDKQGAIADYNEAIRINPNFAIAYYNRGLAKSELGDKKGAIADFRESARLFQQQGNAADYEDAQNRIRKLGG